MASSGAWPNICRKDTLIQIKLNNRPENSGVRTQFFKHIAELATQTGKDIQLLYYPPYHSKHNPVERCWGILEQHWNGAKLINVGTVLAWAENMTRKGMHPVITLSKTIYQNGLTLSKKLMQAFEM